MNKSTFVVSLVAGACAAVAQPPAPPAPLAPPPGEPMMVEFVRSEAATFAGKAVKGVPYAAEGVNESTQILADGNRITRKNSSSVYRDSQGRTRNEHSLGDIGPWASRGEKMVNIFDPVARVSITLHPDKTATKFQLPGVGAAGEMKWVTVEDGNAVMLEKRVEGPRVVASSGGGVISATSGVRMRDMVFERSTAGPTNVFVGAPALTIGAITRDKRSFKTESLGKKVIEGVEADGTRNVSVIAAGEIGNERDIEIVDETWYSKELEALVYSRHSDPRTGETTYRLTNIRRGEQPADLFEVPADYKIQENGKMDFKIRTNKKSE